MRLMFSGAEAGVCQPKLIGKSCAQTPGTDVQFRMMWEEYVSRLRMAIAFFCQCQATVGRKHSIALAYTAVTGQVRSFTTMPRQARIDYSLIWGPVT